MSSSSAGSSAGSYFSSLFGGGSGASGGNAPEAASGGSKAVNTNPEDIPKDDLLHLCMKMNKRMQGLEARGAEISKKYKEVSEEKKQLLDIIKTYASASLPLTIADETLDISVLRERVMSHSAQSKDIIKSLEDRVASMEREHTKELSALELKIRKELTLKASKIAAASGHVGDISECADEKQNTVEGEGQDLYLSNEIDRLMTENEVSV